MVQALEDVRRQDNALVVYLGSFGPESRDTARKTFRRTEHVYRGGRGDDNNRDAVTLTAAC